MTKEDGKKMLKEFSDHIDASQNIRQALGEARDTQISEDFRGKARQTVSKEGSAWYKETRDPTDQTPLVSFDDPRNYDLAEHYASEFATIRDTQASNALRSNLKPMVRSLGKKQLETILSSDEGKPLALVADKAGKDYAAWFKLYQKNFALGGLVGRAESNRLADEDKAVLENRTINDRIKVVAKALEKRGVKDPLVRQGTEKGIQATVAREYASNDKAYANAAKSLKGESDKELKTYEGNNKGRDFYGFVETGFDNLGKSAEGFKTMKALMYSASKVKE